MDIATITTIISNVGFPIAACLAMWGMLQKMTEKHKDEVDSLRDSLEKNTEAIVELKAYIQSKEG